MIQTAETTTTLNGAQIFLECLKKEGVKEIFGYPGGVILSIYEALYTDIMPIEVMQKLMNRQLKEEEKY